MVWHATKPHFAVFLTTVWVRTQREQVADRFEVVPVDGHVQRCVLVLVWMVEESAPRVLVDQLDAACVPPLCGHVHQGAAGRWVDSGDFRAFSDVPVQVA